MNNKEKLDRKRKWRAKKIKKIKAKLSKKQEKIVTKLYENKEIKLFLNKISEKNARIKNFKKQEIEKLINTGRIKPTTLMLSENTFADQKQKWKGLLARELQRKTPNKVTIAELNTLINFQKQTENIFSLEEKIKEQLNDFFVQKKEQEKNEKKALIANFKKEIYKLIPPEESEESEYSSSEEAEMIKIAFGITIRDNGATSINEALQAAKKVIAVKNNEATSSSESESEADDETISSSETESEATSESEDETTSSSESEDESEIDSEAEVERELATFKKAFNDEIDKIVWKTQNVLDIAMKKLGMFIINKDIETSESDSETEPKTKFKTTKDLNLYQNLIIEKKLILKHYHNNKEKRKKTAEQKAAEKKAAAQQHEVIKAQFQSEQEKRLYTRFSQWTFNELIAKQEINGKKIKKEAIRNRKSEKDEPQPGTSTEATAAEKEINRNRKSEKDEPQPGTSTEATAAEKEINRKRKIEKDEPQPGTSTAATRKKILYPNFLWDDGKNNNKHNLLNDINNKSQATKETLQHLTHKLAALKAEQTKIKTANEEATKEIKRNHQAVAEKIATTTKQLAERAEKNDTINKQLAAKAKGELEKPLKADSQKHDRTPEKYLNLAPYPGTSAIEKYNRESYTTDYATGYPPSKVKTNNSKQIKRKKASNFTPSNI